MIYYADTLSASLANSLPRARASSFIGIKLCLRGGNAFLSASIKVSTFIIGRFSKNAPTINIFATCFAFNFVASSLPAMQTISISVLVGGCTAVDC